MEEDINNHAKKTCNQFTHIVRLKVTQSFITYKQRST